MPWHVFSAVFPMPPADELLFKSVLDGSDTGFVSQYKFGELLRGFGPLENVIQNVITILKAP